MQQKAAMMISTTLMVLLMLTPSALAETVVEHYRFVGNDDGEFVTLDMSPKKNEWTNVIVGVTDDNFDATYIFIMICDSAFDCGGECPTLVSCVNACDLSLRCEYSGGCNTATASLRQGTIETLTVYVERTWVDWDSLESCYGSEGVVAAVFS